MGERRIRQAPEIDDVGALDAQKFGARENCLEAHLRRIDDLGEDTQRMARQIERRAGLAEKRWQVFQFIGSALERNAKFLRQAREVSAAAARDDDAIGFDRARQPAHEDGLGHQRRNLHAHVEDRPVERRRLHALQDLLEAVLGEAAGQKQNALPHAATLLRRCAMASLKLGDRVDRRHAGKASQALAVLQIDRARIDLHHSFRRFCLEFGRRVAGEDNGWDAALSGLGKDVGDEIVGDPVDEFGDRVRSRGSDDQRMVDPVVELSDRDRTRRRVAIDAHRARQVELLLVHAQDFSSRLAEEEVDMFELTDQGSGFP